MSECRCVQGAERGEGARHILFQEGWEGRAEFAVSCEALDHWTDGPTHRATPCLPTARLNTVLHTLVRSLPSDPYPLKNCCSAEKWISWSHFMCVCSSPPFTCRPAARMATQTEATRRGYSMQLFIRAALVSWRTGGTRGYHPSPVLSTLSTILRARETFNDKHVADDQGFVLARGWKLPKKVYTQAKSK